MHQWETFPIWNFRQTLSRFSIFVQPPDSEPVAMSETHEPSSNPQKNGPDSKPAEAPDSDPAIDAGESPEDLKQGTVDFNSYTKPVLGSSGVRRQGSMSEPVSGGSIVSWAELLSKHPRSDDEVALGSLPELQIDSISDNAIIKSLEREAKKSGIRRAPERRPKPDATERPASDAPSSNPAAPAKKAPVEEPPDIKDWFRDFNYDTGSSVDLNNAAQQARDSLKDSGGERPDESDVLAAALEFDDGTSKVNLGREPLPAIGMSAAAPPPDVSVSRPVTPPRPIRTQSLHALNLRKPNNLNSWLGGTVIGVGVSAVVWLTLWFSGALGTTRKAVEPPPATTEVAQQHPTPDLARRHLENGEPDLALGAYEQCEESREVLTGRGQARWLTYLRQQKQHNAALEELDADVARARQELISARTAEATLWLGLINETFGHYKLANETYDHGLDNFPDRARLFTAARSRLDALTGTVNNKVAAIVDPQLGLALALALIEMPEQAGGFNALDEAGFDFWEAVRLARKGDYAAGREALLKARSAHEQRRDVIAHRGLNPDSDPRDDIFLHSCDQMIGWWDLQAKLHYAGFKLDGRTPAQVVDTLLASQRKYDEAMKSDRKSVV
jgi:tetratricopeptide (TPR) repeat protein